MFRKERKNIKKRRKEKIRDHKRNKITNVMCYTVIENNNYLWDFMCGHTNEMCGYTNERKRRRKKEKRKIIWIRSNREPFVTGYALTKGAADLSGFTAFALWGYKSSFIYETFRLRGREIIWFGASSFSRRMKFLECRLWAEFKEKEKNKTKKKEKKIK